MAITRRRVVALQSLCDPDELHYSLDQITASFQTQHPEWSADWLAAESLRVFRAMCGDDQQRYNSNRRFRRHNQLRANPDPTHRASNAGDSPND